MRNHIDIEDHILGLLSDDNQKAFQILAKDPEIKHFQDISYTISQERLFHNDHGPLHMRRAALNGIKMAILLKNAGIKLSVEAEGHGDHDDGILGVFTASFLHDIGMSVTRDNHEMTGAYLAMPVLDRFLGKVYSNDLKRKTVLKSLIIEGIMGHMTTKKISSVEAGIVLVADGCDMAKGRARLPVPGDNTGKYGDIHMYSSLAVENVLIEKGHKKPIRICISLSESVGFFQVEEVLLNKIYGSTIRDYIELYSNLRGKNPKQYL